MGWMIYTVPVQSLKQILVYLLIAVIVAGVFNACWYLFFGNWRHLI